MKVIGNVYIVKMSILPKEMSVSDVQDLNKLI
jgi:hypothetical protein